MRLRMSYLVLIICYLHLAGCASYYAHRLVDAPNQAKQLDSMTAHLQRQLGTFVDVALASTIIHVCVVPLGPDASWEQSVVLSTWIIEPQYLAGPVH